MFNGANLTRNSDVDHDTDKVVYGEGWEIIKSNIGE